MHCLWERIAAAFGLVPFRQCTCSCSPTGVKSTLHQHSLSVMICHLQADSKELEYPRGCSSKVSGQSRVAAQPARDWCVGRGSVCVGWSQMLQHRTAESFLLICGFVVLSWSDHHNPRSTSWLAHASHSHALSTPWPWGFEFRIPYAQSRHPNPPDS
jgi:hypothetical protein